MIRCRTPRAAWTALAAAVALAIAGLSCTPQGTRSANPEGSESSQQTQSDFANNGDVEVRSIPKEGGVDFTLVPRATYEWSIPDCTFRIWGGGEDRLDALLKGEPPFLVSTAPRSLICCLPARDNAGRPSRAAVAVELRWRQVALGRPDLRGATRMEFFVDRAGVMSLKRAYDPDRRDGAPPDAGRGK